MAIDRLHELLVRQIPIAYRSLFYCNIFLISIFSKIIWKYLWIKTGSMSGMGPASCWVTHKRLESWARAAKERALGSHSSKNNENSSNSTSSNNSVEVCLKWNEKHIVYVLQGCSNAYIVQNRFHLTTNLNVSGALIVLN